MKTRPHCRVCLNDLARRVVDLSGGKAGLLTECGSLVDTLYGALTPPAIANRLLHLIRSTTDVDDPFEERKEEEFRGAREAAERFSHAFPSSFEGALWRSAFGNAVDFFIDEPYDPTSFRFSGPLEQIDAMIDRGGPDLLILGDNVGEFLFDLPLIRLLEARGKRVFYAVKEGPVQNDLSMKEVEHFGLTRLFSRIISTGTRSVGLARDEMAGLVRELWEGDGLVIAKGMGNFETISEFAATRPIVYIMKVKCRTVSEAIGKAPGTYTAILGGEYGE